ncbi:BLMA_like domain containing protein [Rhabdaerophilaceae bacterium]
MENRPSLVPELLVSNLAASLQFWVDLVGFSVLYDRPEEGFSYLVLGRAEVMLEECNPAFRQWVTASLDAPFGRGINFQIDVPDLDRVLQRLHVAAYPLFMAPETKSYRINDGEVHQRQFLLQDPDGYLLRLCQSG